MGLKKKFGRVSSVICAMMILIQMIIPPLIGASASADSSSSSSIYSIPASSIPAPTGNGVMSFKVMNGTNGAYSDSQIFWGVLGINPANGKWSYLDLNGNLLPISLALNNAPGHLTKNGTNYANIYLEHSHHLR
ncbi:hypothetical protein [Paenibacillus tyrfis]|uniref:hypothetical protein n=1 Tax=Paenibacillus tyrfis TaxID=1501230 RepID=UPI0021653119|nr:hypothetical protein [Paenibacillus tyrfis]